MSEEDKLQNHINDDNDKRLKWLEDRYSTFNEEFGTVKSDVKWLVKFFWIVATSSIGSLITAIFNILSR